MKLSIDIKSSSSPEWIQAVINDFESFLKDHADCERKASGMAQHLIAKYADRTAIIPGLIDLMIEEMEHFRDVYDLMQSKNISLNKNMVPDAYVNALQKLRKSDVDGRFMDTLLLGSVIECRGAERFKMIAYNIEDEEMAKFYKRLWTSEAKHGHIFVKWAINYFDEKTVYDRLDWLMDKESEIIKNLPIKSALH